MSGRKKKGCYRHKHYIKKSEKVDKIKQINSIKDLVKDHKYSKALAEVEKYLYEFPNDSYGLFQKATILLFLKDFDEAEYIYKQIIDMNLESKYSSLYKLGLLHELKMDKETAEEYFRKNVEESPFPEIYSRIEIARLESMKGNYGNAYTILDGFYDRSVNGLDKINVFEIFSNISQNDKNKMNLEKANIRCLTQQIDEARAIMKKIVLGDNEIIEKEYYLLMGKIEQHEKNFELATEYFKKAQKGTKLDIYWKAKLEIAITKIKLNDYEDAICICNEVIEKNFENRYLAFKIKADVLKKMGYYDEAEKYYLKSGEINKNKCTEEYYFIGKIRFFNKKYEESLEYFNKCKAPSYLLENDCNFYTMVNLIKLKRYEEAYKYRNIINKNILNPLKRREYKYAELFLKSKLNKEYEQENDSYLYKQVVNYNFDDALVHINRKHTKDDLENKFNEDVNIEELILLLPDLLEKEDTKLVQNYFFETYEIPYANLGKENGQDTDILKVVLLPNSYNVITMHPCKKEINEKENNNSKNKVKKI